MIDLIPNIVNAFQKNPGAMILLIAVVVAFIALAALGVKASH